MTPGRPPERRSERSPERFEPPRTEPSQRSAPYERETPWDAGSEWDSQPIEWGPEREVPPLAGQELPRVPAGDTEASAQGAGLAASMIFGLVGLSLLLGGILTRSMLEATVGLMIMGFALSQLSPEEGQVRRLPVIGPVSKAAFDMAVNALKVTWLVLLIVFIVL